jgi:hypothetical protein
VIPVSYEFARKDPHRAQPMGNGRLLISQSQSKPNQVMSEKRAFLSLCMKQPMRLGSG